MTPEEIPAALSMLLGELRWQAVQSLRRQEVPGPACERGAEVFRAMLPKPPKPDCGTMVFGWVKLPDRTVFAATCRRRNVLCKWNVTATTSIRAATRPRAPGKALRFTKVARDRLKTLADKAV